jgi:hypothetical protein
MFNIEQKDFKERLRYKEDPLEESIKNIIKFIPTLDYEDPLTYAILLNLKKDLSDEDKELIRHVMQDKADEEYQKMKTLSQQFEIK